MIKIISRKSFNEKHILALVSVFAVIATGFAIYYYKTSSDYREKVESSYQKSFTELVDYIGNIDVILNKALVTNDVSQLSDLSEQLWTETALAKSALGQLPISSIELDNTSNFITQVSDYIHVLTKKLLNGGKITDKENKEISQLADYSDKLNDSLKNMENDFMSGDMTLSEKSTKSVLSRNNVTNINDGLESIEDSFEDYPTLIYDGPFAEHILNKKAEVLKQKDVSKEQAQKTASDFVGKEMIFTVEANGNIPSYIFSSKDNTVCVEVSKNGGHVVMMTDSNAVKNPRLTPDEASKYAKKFLENKKYPKMKQTGYTTDGNIASFAFAYTEGEYVIYSDLIKIKVSLHDGKICGFESNGYLCNHTERVPPEPIVSQNQVLENVKNILTVEKVNLACIPKDNGAEAWCYEIKAICKNKTFLIYVNTQTGREEEIMMVIEDGNGSLTI